MLTRRREGSDDSSSKGRKIQRVCRFAACKDMFGSHELKCVCDVYCPYLEMTLGRQVHREKLNHYCHQLWRSEHAQAHLGK